jgi:biotin transport system substrate-specific component
MASTSTTNTVFGHLVPQTAATRIATRITTVLLGSVVLALSAKISVPVLPVPVTLQTLAVALLAAAFGARMALATVALYLVEGLSGLPVFATGGGLDYVLRPSFGFLVGYLPMAYIIGAAADRGWSKSIVKMAGVMLVADAVAFTFGFAWLLVVANVLLASGAQLPGWLAANDLVGTALRGAVLPFIGWDVLKMAFAALSVAGIWQVLRRKA